MSSDDGDGDGDENEHRFDEKISRQFLNAVDLVVWFIKRKQKPIRYIWLVFSH